MPWTESCVFEMLYFILTAHPRKNITRIFRCSWSFQIHRTVYFSPRCFYIYTLINADVGYALASRGEFYGSCWGAASLRGWGGENKHWLSSGSLQRLMRSLSRERHLICSAVFRLLDQTPKIIHIISRLLKDSVLPLYAIRQIHIDFFDFFIFFR